MITDLFAAFRKLLLLWNSSPLRKPFTFRFNIVPYHAVQITAPPEHINTSSTNGKLKIPYCLNTKGRG